MTVILFTELENIAQSEWSSSPRPYAFCAPENTPFCNSFLTMDGNHNASITIPHPGVYQLTCSVAWIPFHANDALNAQAQASQHGDAHVFTVELSVARLGALSTEVLAADHVVSDCNDNTGRADVPCARGHLHVRTQLRAGDHILVAVTYKALLSNRYQYSFLEISKDFNYF